MEKRIRNKDEYVENMNGTAREQKIARLDVDWLMGLCPIWGIKATDYKMLLKTELHLTI